MSWLSTRSRKESYASGGELMIDKGTLTDFMSSGPIVVLALEKENAIADLRTLMGATNPANAEEGTIRKKWATNIEHNAIHGSDAEDTARFELSFFFAGYELSK